MWIKVFVEKKSRVFNVNSILPLDTVVEKVGAVKPKYCGVIAGPGFKRKRGRALSLKDALDKIAELHFYRYREETKREIVYYPIATFYEKPFEVEWVEHIGATFFNRMNERVISNEKDAVKDLLSSYGLRTFISKLDHPYCWKHLELLLKDGKWTLVEVGTELRTTYIKEEYPNPPEYVYNPLTGDFEMK